MSWSLWRPPLPFIFCFLVLINRNKLVLVVHVSVSEIGCLSSVFFKLYIQGRLTATRGGSPRSHKFSLFDFLVVSVVLHWELVYLRIFSRLILRLLHRVLLGFLQFGWLISSRLPKSSLPLKPCIATTPLSSIFIPILPLVASLRFLWIIQSIFTSIYRFLICFHPAKSLTLAVILPRALPLNPLSVLIPLPVSIFGASFEVAIAVFELPFEALPVFGDPGAIVMRFCGAVVSPPLVSLPAPVSTSIFSVPRTHEPLLLRDIVNSLLSVGWHTPPPISPPLPLRPLPPPPPTPSIIFLLTPPLAVLSLSFLRFVAISVVGAGLFLLISVLLLPSLKLFSSIYRPRRTF